ncbi:hypothetical protein [Olsenella profusa]|nr:hypothetical protein [Olsenella profusa]
MQEDRRAAYLAKTRREIVALVERGVRMVGNALSSVCLVKGDLSDAERTGAPLLGGPDGTALRASLTALGYAPEDWCGLAAVDEGGRALDAELLRLAVVTLDPDTLIVCDETAAAALREALADELVGLPDIHQSMLEAGLVVDVLGMRVLNLGGFAAALGEEAQKQLMWARLKQLPPLGEPY